MKEYVERRMKLLPRVIMPLNRIGVKLDRKLHQKLLRQHRESVRNWRQRCARHFRKHDLGEPPLGAKGGFSNPKLFKLLYEDLKLPEQHDPKDGHVTAARDALRRLAKLDKTGTVALLLVRSEAKTTEKELATAAKCDRDGRVRSRFVFGGDEKSDENEAGKESPGTGRLASRDPNLQNINKRFRALYVPSRPSGWMMCADYSQIEFRLTAEMSGDDELKKALEEDAYLYVMNAVDKRSNVYGLHQRGWRKLFRQYKADKPEVVIARDEGKKIALGWSYRMGAKKLENVKGVPFRTGQRALRDLNEIFWRVVAWWDELVRECRANGGGGEWGFLELPWGRRRYFLMDDVPKICNFPSQGGAAEILYDAMEELVPETPKKFRGTKVVLTAHDELVFDVAPSTDVLELADYARSVMERPIPELDGLVVPVEIKVGRNWGKRHVCESEDCPIPANVDGVVKLSDWEETYVR